jgi:hypothetical protein
MKPEAFWLLILAVIVAVIFEFRAMHREMVQQRQAKADEEAKLTEPVTAER